MKAIRIRNSLMQVLTSYHFFAHYREPVLRAMVSSTIHEHFFCADTRDPDGNIKEAGVADSDRFSAIRTVRVGRVLVQPGMVGQALKTRAGAIVMLGDAAFLTTWLAAAVARLRGRRVLFWTHGWTRRENGAKAWVRRMFYGLAHGLLLYGQRAKAIGVRQGFAADSLYVIYNSLDYSLQRRLRSMQSEEELRELRRVLFGADERPIVLCVSRLTSHRRLDQLIDAVALLQRQGHLLHVLLVGDGPMRTELEAQAAELGVSLRCVGPCYEEERLCRYTMISAVTAAPGMVGLTAMQSLAYGTPVVTHGDFDNQMPEAEAIEPGVSGDFFARGDVADLARVLKDWTQSIRPSAHVQVACIGGIEERYTPEFQVKIIDAAVSGVPAGDLPHQDVADRACCVV